MLTGLYGGRLGEWIVRTRESRDQAAINERRIDVPAGRRALVKSAGVMW